MNESSIALKVAMDTANRTNEARHAELKTTLREYATVRALSAVKDELDHQLEAHGQRTADLRADLENRATNRALDAVKEAAVVREQTVNAVCFTCVFFLFSRCSSVCLVLYVFISCVSCAHGCFIFHSHGCTCVVVMMVTDVRLGRHTAGRNTWTCSQALRCRSGSIECHCRSIHRYQRSVESANGNQPSLTSHDW
jgi:hypothetical protein